VIPLQRAILTRPRVTQAPAQHGQFGRPGQNVHRHVATESSAEVEHVNLATVAKVTTPSPCTVMIPSVPLRRHGHSGVRVQRHAVMEHSNATDFARPKANVPTMRLTRHASVRWNGVRGGDCGVSGLIVPSLVVHQSKRETETVFTRLIRMPVLLWVALSPTHASVLRKSVHFGVSGANGPSVVPHVVVGSDVAVVDACMDQAVQVARTVPSKLKSVDKTHAQNGANGQSIVLVQSLVARETRRVLEHVKAVITARVITLTQLIATLVHVLSGQSGVNSRPVRSRAAMVPKSVTELVPVVLLVTIVTVKCAKVSSARLEHARAGQNGRRSQHAVLHVAVAQ